MMAVVLSAFLKNLITSAVVLVISTLVYSNSAVNPVLYGYFHRDFRLAYKRQLSCFSLPCRGVHVPRKRSYELSGMSARDTTSAKHCQRVYITERQQVQCVSKAHLVCV